MKTLAANCGALTRRFILVSAGILSGATLQANPKGPQVTNGTITINQKGGVMTINQATAKGIIHWQDFSIGAGELTQFVHPNANAATLNRVVGGIPSTIQGTLQANGQIYLVNPNGIVVGPSGRINTAAFVASTLDVPDAQFLAGGDMHFTGNSLQGVSNFGTITATNGDVILLGHYVQNAGTINAPNGVAALAAGDDILLQAAGDERVVVNSGIPTGGTGVQNSGRINAAQAELKAAGGNVYALAVNNTGVVKATGIATKNGRVILSANGGVVQNSGQIAAQNVDGSGGSVRLESGKGGTTTNTGSINAAATDPKKNGGTVELLGDTVNVGGSSVIDVGGANAGTVSIGVSAMIANQATATGGIANLTAASAPPTTPGAVPSATPAVSSAQQTTIQANSRILANATSATGNGGHIVVWSEKQTIVGGILEANAGALDGNGGVVETSGRSGLTIVPGTVVHTSAPKGKPGTWLLDPDGITIDNNTTDTSGFTQNLSTNHVKASDIATALQSGNVNIVTSGSFSPNTDITVASAIVTDNSFPANTLSLLSAGGINVNAGIGGTNTQVILHLLSHGDINLASTGSLLTNGVSLDAITGNINIDGAVTTQGSSNAFLTAYAGSVIMSNTGTVTSRDTNIGAATGVSIDGQISSTSNGNITVVTPGGSIGFLANGKISAGTGNVYFDTHNSADGQIIAVYGNQAVVAGGLDLWTSHNGAGSSTYPINMSVDHLIATVETNGKTTGGGIVIKNSSASDLHIGGVTGLPGQFTGGILIPTLAGFGGVEINNVASAIRLDSGTGERIAVPGNIKLTTGSGSDIQVLNTSSNSLVSHFGSVTLNAAGSVLIGNAGTNTWGVNVRGETNVDVIAGGDVTVAGSLLKAGGASGLTVTAGGDVNILNSNGFAAIMGTSGNASINITTGAGKTFNDNTASNGGVLTKLADDLTNTVATGANISITADKVVINAPINAGNSSVGIGPVTNTRAMEIATVKDSSKLSFTVAELNKITAGTQLTLGTFAGNGSFAVNAPLSAPSTFNFLLITTGGTGNVSVSQPLTMSSGTLTLQAGSSGNIALNNTVTAGNLNLIAGANIDASFGKVSTNHLTFFAGGNAVLTNANNNIAAINTGSLDVSGAAQINLNTTSNLAVNGQLGYGGGGTTSILVQLSGYLTLNPGAQLVADNISLNIYRNLINNSGRPGDDALKVTGRYRVWESDLYGNGRNPGNLQGSNYTSAAVFFPSDPLGAGNVFYFAKVTPAAPPTPAMSPPVTSAPLGFQLKNGGVRALQSVGASNLEKFAEEIFAITNLADLTALLSSDPTILTDPKKLQIWAQWNSELISDAVLGIHIMTNAEVAQRKAEDQALQYQQDQLDALAARLGRPLNAAEQNAFFGITQYNLLLSASILGPPTVNPSSLSPAQISQLSESQLLRLLASAGMPLTKEQSALAQSATLSKNELASIFKSGPVNTQIFTAVVGAGAGNLTMSEILAAATSAGVVSQGGGNAISNNGSSVVSQGGGNAISNNGSSVVSQGGGNFLSAIAAVVSQGGGNLTLASVVSQGGGNVVSQGGGNVVSQGGGNAISNNGSSVVSQGGGNFYNIMSGLIGSDGMGLLAKASAVVSQGGGNAISNNGSSLVGPGGSSLVGSGGSSAISNNGSSLVNTNGSNILGHNGSAAISNNGSALINTNGSNAIQLQNGAGAVSPLIK